MGTKIIAVLHVVATNGRDTYRAGGRVFSRSATQIPLTELTEAEVERLRGDPWLSAEVTLIPIAVEGEDDEHVEAIVASLMGSPFSVEPSVEDAPATDAAATETRQPARRSPSSTK